MRKKTEGGHGRCALRKRATGKGECSLRKKATGGFALRKKAEGGCVEGEGQWGDLGRHVPHAPSVASQ